MLRKKEVYTTITPIPGFIPRQLAIDILHSHGEVITLNPLVLDHKPIPAPRNAASDEFYSTWYEITERIQYVPGMGKMGSGKISFNGCFHDTAWGLQTHIYAPMSVDLRNKYRIAGNQPGVEPPEEREIGMAELGVPADGLYLREDIEIRCNIAVVSFVKSQLKAASKEMVRRIIKKAELLDAGVLKAMIHDGRLKTINPNDLSAAAGLAAAAAVASSSGGSPPPTPYHPPPLSPRLGHQSMQYGGYQGLYPQHTGQQPQQGLPPQGGAVEMPTGQQVPQQGQQMAPVEMAGDFYHPQASPSFQNHQHPQRSPSFQHPLGSPTSQYSQGSPTFQHRQNRDSAQSGQSGQFDPRSYYRNTMQGGGNSQTPPPPPGSGYGATGPDQKRYSAEADKKTGYHYNPQDFSGVRG
ncbi:uncharacterized protein DNG_08246 [Cephalotrichum gorgonifer]|uniref:DUF7053 domain-containing protein n=1 Tax=Cephalotrichum gorgonifer TaxID=2041049 RepID=A0AAE8N4Q5_9PEZI|nr:uncharacterized protein DNG_08246 [Cephalotrichum gorgonifer]